MFYQVLEITGIPNPITEVSVVDPIAAFDNLTEIFEVVRTLELVKKNQSAEPQKFRLDIVKRHRPDSNTYEAFCWRYEQVNAQPAYPRSGKKFLRKPEDMQVLVSIPIPAMNEQTVENALYRAISFLSMGQF